MEFQKNKIGQNKKLEKSRTGLGHGKKEDSWLTSRGLGPREKHIILNNEWLIDNIMDAASALLRRDYPMISGLVNASFSLHGFIYNPCEGIQVHNLNQCHWVISSSIGGIIKVYDSLKSNIPCQDLKRQLNELYSGNNGNVSFERVKCQQQVGSVDCGLFAIANAVELLEGNNITGVVFDQSQMRNHLIKCLENDKLTPFPRKRIAPETNEVFDRFHGDWLSPKSSRKSKGRKEERGITTRNFFDALPQPTEQGEETEADKKAEKEVITETEEGSEIRKCKKKWKAGDLVLNLSSKELTPSQKEVCCFGIKFCPYPVKINMFNCFKDIAAFCRRMRLKEYFLNSEPNERPEWMKANRSS
jgi:hypothetical protein